ncbi:MAG: hypothetical protein V3S14_08660 [Anaerolineae bacterium]
MLLGILLLLVVIKERYDPFLLLFLGDWLDPKPAPLTVPLDDDLALRLYEDTRPHVGKVASLQKGLILVHQGQELIEEGFGFGMPIIQVDDVAYLSRHTSTALVQGEDGATLVKVYTIDVADRPTRFLQVKYEDVDPLGTVVFSYTLRSPDIIAVEVDFTGLEVAWDRAYLMNEQGAINFPTYQDSQGQTWNSDKVGRWHPTETPVNCWVSREGEIVRFCVETEPGRRKFVGRERYNQYRWTGIFYLSWSGVDIEIDSPVPRYRYTVRVEAIP